MRERLPRSCTRFRAREIAAVHANPMPNHAQPNGCCLASHYESRYKTQPSTASAHTRSSIDCQHTPPVSIHPKERLGRMSCLCRAYLPLGVLVDFRGRTSFSPMGECDGRQHPEHARDARNRIKRLNQMIECFF